ncbi:HEPN domain-containing protein [Kineococcus sp. SYSU DK001]|uniref:HEPN domain-containing protein n=1 Tax=Kineococcus sp. SYSU DK001 TaxID=3383122 RepID=UPI003D7CA0B7
MPSHARFIFDQLASQVRSIASLASQPANQTMSDTLCRCAVVLTVSALDTYMHELGAEILHTYASRGANEASVVAQYIRSGSAASVQGPKGRAHLEFELLTRTLTDPDQIDKLLTASGKVADDVWRQTGIALRRRERDLKSAINAQVLRRNAIAHHGDWDAVQIAFRHLSVGECTSALNDMESIVHAFDKVMGY